VGGGPAVAESKTDAELHDSADTVWLSLRELRAEDMDSLPEQVAYWSI
jgi:hypothetical protein